MTIWNTRPLGELAQNISRRFDFSDKSKVVFINTGDVLEGEFLHKNYSDSKGLPGQAKKAIKRGDILYSEIRPGNKRYVFVDFDADDYVVSTKFMVIKANDEILPEFLYLILKSKECEQEFKLIAESRSGTFPQITFDSVAYYPVKYPDKKAQRRIIEIANSINGKAKLNTQTNQTLEQIAQAIFKSWFVDFEPVKAKMAVLEADGTTEQAELAAMSVISAKDEAALKQLQAERPESYAELAQTAALFPSAMEESELGEIPAGWDTFPLDKIAHYQNGLAFQKFRPKNENDFLPVVKIAQLKKGFADGEEKASPDIKPECIIDDGDVVFSWSGSLVVDIWCGGKAALNQHLFKVTSENYPKWFYYYFTKHHLAEFQRIAADKAVTMGHIKREHLASAKCAIPTDALIAKGNKLIGSLLEKQIEQRLEANALAETRDALLPKLLAGDLPIPSTEEV